MPGNVVALIASMSLLALFERVFVEQAAAGNRASHARRVHTEFTLFVNLVSARQRKAGVPHSHSHCAFREPGRIISWPRQVVHVCSRIHTEFTLFVNQLCPGRPTESAASSH